MSLMRVTSPHDHGPLHTGAVMRAVLMAAVPGVAALTWFFGFGTLVNICVACLAAIGCESLALTLRRRPLAPYLRDGSALVTAALLAIAMPPASPWWLLAIGAAFSILIAKHLYGGLGYNPFNPAMAGYVVLLISFPVEMTAWLAPEGTAAAGPLGTISFSGLGHALLACFTPGFAAGVVDGATMATPLDLLRQNTALTSPLPLDDLRGRNPQFGRWGGLGWEWVNAGFLLGGAWLLYRRIFTWHAPAGMLGALALLSLIFYDGGQPGGLGSPLFHLFSGGTMFGAFFIITDPVTSAVSNRGRLIYGALAGALVFIIRSWGHYPDAVAFAVLLANFAAPFIDYYAQPRTYGHGGGRGGDS